MSTEDHVNEYGDKYVVSGTRRLGNINTPNGALKIGHDMYYEGGMKNKLPHGKGLYISPNVVFDGWFNQGHIDAKSPKRRICRMYVYNIPRIRGCPQEFNKETPYTLAFFGRFRSTSNSKPSPGNSFFDACTAMPGSVAYYRPNNSFWVMGNGDEWILDDRSYGLHQRTAPDWTPPTPNKQPVGVLYENNDERELVKQQMGHDFMFKSESNPCTPYMCPMAQIIVEWSDGKLGTYSPKILKPDHFSNPHIYHKVYYEIDKLLYKKPTLYKLIAMHGTHHTKNIVANKNEHINEWGSFMLSNDNGNAYNDGSTLSFSQFPPPPSFSSHSTTSLPHHSTAQPSHKPHPRAITRPRRQPSPPNPPMNPPELRRKHPSQFIQTHQPGHQVPEWYRHLDISSLLNRMSKIEHELQETTHKIQMLNHGKTNYLR